jgi:5-oxoprolinase (ATP-hydrolysing)
VIGFDMGGTSTDVCHFDGRLRARAYETVVAGVRMRAPMMHIHTVAAGGGSICSLRERRAVQGRPGLGRRQSGSGLLPARRGPLTVTDCNVMLGKLSSQNFFPACSARTPTSRWIATWSCAKFERPGRQDPGARPARVMTPVRRSPTAS